VIYGKKVELVEFVCGWRCAWLWEGSVIITRNVTVWRPSVCPSFCPVDILTVIHQGAARDAASVYFGLTIRRTDIILLARSLDTRKMNTLHPVAFCKHLSAIIRDWRVSCLTVKCTDDAKHERTKFICQ